MSSRVLEPSSHILGSSSHRSMCPRSVLECSCDVLTGPRAILEPSSRVLELSSHVVAFRISVSCRRPTSHRRASITATPPFSACKPPLASPAALTGAASKGGPAVASSGGGRGRVGPPPGRVPPARRQRHLQYAGAPTCTPFASTSRRPSTRCYGLWRPSSATLGRRSCGASRRPSSSVILVIVAIVVGAGHYTSRALARTMCVPDVYSVVCCNSLARHDLARTSAGTRKDARKDMQGHVARTCKYTASLPVLATLGQLRATGGSRACQCVRAQRRSGYVSCSVLYIYGL
jgi:hypothetical protein